MKRMILTVGAPASGKSTWAVKRKIRYGSVVTERDAIRKEHGKTVGKTPYGPHWNKHDEKEVTRIQKETIVRALRENKEVIVSDTNINPKTRERFKSLAAAFECEIKFVPFIVDHNILIARNAQRPKEDYVPENVLRDFCSRMIKDFPFIIDPTRSTIDCNKVIYPEAGGELSTDNLGARVNENFMIMDLDGTLAIMHNRGPYEDYHADRDLLNEHVYNMMVGMQDRGYEVVLMSGRDGGRSREVTERWLERHGIQYKALYMRESKDTFKDNVVKHDMLRKFYTEHGYVPGLAVDDRDQIVRLWRDMGIQCFQVADGNF